MHTRSLTVIGVVLALLAGSSVAAQGPEGAWTPQVVDEPGICDGGVICGPSGAMTTPDFPTAIGIDWTVFPANPLRPHSPASGGRMWIVAPGGSDEAAGEADSPLATIDRALALARTGDVIQVADGEYPVGLWDDSLIMATPGVTLMAEHIGGATLVPLNAEWDWLPAIKAEADDLVIDGFVIRGFVDGVGLLFGRLDSPQRRLVLRHLRIDGVGDALRSTIPDQPVNPQPVIDGLLVYDVAIRDAAIGFNCGEGPCHNMRLEALDVALPGAGEGSGADAVAVENGDHIVVFNAHITGAAADGLDFKATRVAIANVIVHDVARNGIKLWRGGEVINALVYRTGADAALVLETGNTYRVVNSAFAYHAEGESAYAGTVAYDSPDEPGNLTVLNTIFYRNSGALWVSGAFALDVRASIFFGSANGQELIWATEPELALGEDEQPPEALDAAGGGHGLSFTDPGFIDPEQGDFRPAAGAALIDRGESAESDLLPPFDLLGQPRIGGMWVDLGPYEAQPGG